MDSDTPSNRRQALVVKLNPLRVSGTGLPPNVLLAAKLLALAYVLTGQLSILPDPFLPFIPYLEFFHGSDSYRHAIQAVVLTAACLLWTNTIVRTSCLLIGLAVVLTVLSSEVYYSNNILYTGLFFIIAGLYDQRLRSIVFRAQLSVTYFGAALNKLLDPAWRTGAFMQDWLRPPHYITGRIYTELASLLPGRLLSGLLSWLAILTEFALIPLLLVPRLVPLAIFVGVAYHTGLVLITGGWTFNMFWYAAVATYIALLEWPRRGDIVYSPERRLQRIARSILGYLDADRRFQWHPHRTKRLELSKDGQSFTGVPAVAKMLLYTPAFYFTCLVLFTLTDRYGRAAIPFLTYALLLAIGSSSLRRVQLVRPRSGSGGPGKAGI